MSVEMNVDQEAVVQIVASVFSTMMNVEVSAVRGAWPAGEERFTSSVYLEGDWNGAVLLNCNQEQACAFAGNLLCMDPPEAVDDDVRDVLGELANVIGGNLKSVMGGDVRLSLPSVIEGDHYEVQVCGSKVLHRIGFHFGGDVFWVTVLGSTMASRDGAPSRDAAGQKLCEV